VLDMAMFKVLTNVVCFDQSKVARRLYLSEGMPAVVLASVLIRLFIFRQVPTDLEASYILTTHEICAQWQTQLAY